MTDVGPHMPRNPLSRWRVAAIDFFCESCGRRYDSGAIHIGYICAWCVFPKSGRTWSHCSEGAVEMWIRGYVREITRMVRARRRAR